MHQSTLWSVGDRSNLISGSIDAALEIGAYEALWCEHNASFKSIAERFRGSPGSRPSHLVPETQAREVGSRVLAKLRERTRQRFDIRIHGEWEYPERLRDAADPVELLYIQGDWDLVTLPAVAVVGTRKPSPLGIERTQTLAYRLVRDGFTVVSGLAEGVDTAAHSSAIAAGGRTIGVIGTPLGKVYPKANAALQEQIARDHLLISQVPVLRYDAQDFRSNRFFFPERNKLMSALTQATIIVEAGETSGTLVQAREALRQGRKLFIMNSCFERKDLTWPARFEEQGAIRIHSYADVRRELVSADTEDR
ncbi:DNA-processing protein DprA [Sphingomonas pokkalii]|uniref:DNA processing protein DprA n=1 Tax=Sphingomonas pokkalii TaxID=2175090 RepID=A0A2U0SHW8_9SPHN|nr:DNA-processing protein DprA [Sphingomonas pokkalii]PVX30951.1 DNA processing protein DprA [Sphingomonas pokkalii]